MSATSNPQTASGDAAVADAPRKRRPALRFTDEQSVIDDIRRLRQGYVQAGRWSLPQMCFHLTYPIESSLRPPQSTEPTADQKKSHQFIDAVGQNGWPDKQLDAPEPMRPPPNPGDGVIDHVIEVLQRLANYKDEKLETIFFGPLETARFRKFILAHAAHHLAYLAPKAKARRPNLTFADEGGVIDDVKHLRKGYEQAGSWSLPQVCCHLDMAVKTRMAPEPFPPDTDEQASRKPIAEKILASGQLPDGLVAPEPMQPPPHCGDEAIDAFLATMQKFKTFSGPIAPHRIFGTLSDADAHKLNLMHCARHLSFLTPTT